MENRHTPAPAQLLLAIDVYRGQICEILLQ